MDSVIDEMVKLAAAGLLSVLMALAVKLLQRAGISLDADKQEKLRSLAADGISRAEEWAAGQIKAKVAKKIPGSDKLAQAVEHVIAKMPGVTRDEAEAVVTAMLPQMGLGAAAGVRELGKAIRSK